jgi:hypothetical protein
MSKIERQPEIKAAGMLTQRGITIPLITICQPAMKRIICIRAIIPMMADVIGITSLFILNLLTSYQCNREGGVRPV